MATVLQFQPAVTTLVPSANVPAAKSDSGSPKDDRRFDRVLDSEGARQGAYQGAKADAANDAPRDTAGASKAGGDPKNGTDRAESSKAGTDKAEKLAKDDGSPDPKAVLGWLQGQIGSADPAVAPGTVPAPPLPADPAAAPITSTTTAATGFTLTVIPKTGSRPGDTPPTQRPADPAPASLSGAADTAADTAGDDGAAPSIFKLPQAGKPAEESATLTPALSAALASAVTASPANASDLVARGVEQFQAMLGRSEGSTTSAPATPAAAPAPTAAALLAMPLAVDSPDLPARLGERLQWLVNSGAQEARMQLHPRELGTVNVQVRIEAQGASVWFAAEHPAARAALESAMPQLRERFAADGVVLGQAQVASQTGGWTFGNSQQQSQPQSWTTGAGSSSTGLAANDSEAIGTAVSRPIIHLGLIDRYA